MTVLDIHTREVEKHALEAFHTTDALANAKTLDDMHKRMAQLTDIYIAAMKPLLEYADAITDDGHAKDFLEGLQDLCGETFDKLPEAAQTIREQIRGGY